MDGLRNSTVLKYLVLVGKPDTVSYPELIAEIHRHIVAEKAFLEASKLSQDILLEGGKKKLDSQVEALKQNDNDNGKKSKTLGNQTQNNHDGDNYNGRGRSKQAQIPQFQEYTPLTEMAGIVFTESEHCEIFNILPSVKTPKNIRDNSKYCRYHHDTENTTEECRTLKGEVERLIQRAQLREYVRGTNQQPC